MIIESKTKIPIRKN